MGNADAASTPTREKTDKTRDKKRELTGRGVLAIALGAFAVILAANLTMVFAATGSFPGLVAKNSWVASQTFNIRAAEREALGWSAAIDFEDDVLTLTMTDRSGAPISGLEATALVGRPVDARTDALVPLRYESGVYVAPLELARGAWRVEIDARAANGDALVGATEFVVP